MDVGKSIGFNDICFLNREEEQRLLFETALIVLLYFDEELFICPYSDIESLLLHYPEFKMCGEKELNKLLNFTNFMNCALRLLPAKGTFFAIENRIVGISIFMYIYNSINT